MTTKPLALTTLALLLATTLATPSADALAYNDCIDGIQLAASQRGATLVNLDGDFAGSCVPERCPPGSVGTEGKCIPVEIGGVCAGTTGSVPEQCGIGTCPKDSYGVVLNGRPTCMTAGGVCDDPESLADCGIQPCPTGQVGVTANRKAFCVDEPEAPDVPTVPKVPDVPPAPDVPSTPGLEPPPGEVCKDYENDNGMGGTHVKCHYDCYVGDTLGIYGESHDREWGVAEANGYTSCGGADAQCDIHPAKWMCAGAGGPVQWKAANAECHGWSKETFDSGYDVACYTIGACTILGLVCEHVATASPATACTDFLAGSPGSQALRGLLSGLPDAVKSAVAFTVQDGAGFYVRYVADGGTGASACEGGSFHLG